MIEDDNVPESNEDFYGLLQTSDEDVILEPQNATVLIVNDDSEGIACMHVCVCICVPVHKYVYVSERQAAGS